MNVIGLNFNHSDTSACLIIDNNLIAAAEEERFNRIKHTNAFPKQSIEYCLKEGNLKLKDIDIIAINTRPTSNILKKFIFSIKKLISPKLAIRSLKNIKKKKQIKKEIKKIFSDQNFNGKIEYIDHHLSHLASAYYCSDFKNSICLSIDGFGDFASLAYGFASENNIKIDKKIYFPHSLGILYQAVTQYLGFDKYGDEYKVMGLSSYGTATYKNQLSKLFKIKKNFEFELDTKYFNHHIKDITINSNQQFDYMDLFNSEFEKIIGFEKRNKNTKIESYHINLAKSVQEIYENYLINIINFLNKKYNCENLCLSGGCAANSVANGKILKETKIKKLYIPSAPGDAGGAIGAAYQSFKHRKAKYLNTASLGPSYDSQHIKDQIDKLIDKKKYKVSLCENNEKLANIISELIIKKKIIGLFCGKMEFGSRALGNRSILADPRESDIRDIINLKTKKRESFRPFAPAILKEKVNEWFHINHEVSFMSEVYEFREDKKKFVPAVCHVDGTGRLQTVSKENNELYYLIIKNFFQLTNIPILLNTSFNENEPIVCHPSDAIQTFMSTKIDALVLENWIIER